MRGKKRLLTAIIALLTLIFGQLPPASAEPGLPSSGGTQNPYILQIPAVQQDALNALLIELGIEIDATYTKAISGFALKLNNEQKDYLRYFYPSLVISPDSVTTLSDSQNPANWNLSTLDQRGSSVDTSYVYPAAAGDGVKVYVIDTGIATNASQLGSRLLAGKDFTGSGSYVDCNGHGTHVAGTVASAKYGVAKKAKVVPLKVLDCSGSGQSSWAISAIEWAITDNPAGTRAVINMSLGAAGSNAAMNTAVANATSDGIFVAVAAGNETSTACGVSPANAPMSYTVGAIDRNNNEASFSNYGNCVDIYAPGVNIESLNYSDSSAYSSNTKSGTSMATPHVAGAAAIYFSVNPTSTVAQAKAAFNANAEQGVTFLYHPNSASPDAMLDITWLNGELSNTAAPRLTAASVGPTGKPLSGSVITATPGVWESGETLGISRQWYTCTSASVASSAVPEGCDAVPGATGLTYVSNTTHEGKYILVSETATSSTKNLTETSATLGYVVTAPSLLTEPSIDGLSAVGDVLTATTGSWSGYPNPGTSFQWYSCSSASLSNLNSIPAGCSSIAGATAPSYTVTQAQAGRHILAGVSANNEGGTKYRYTRTARQTPTQPTVISPPTISVGDGAQNGAPRYVDSARKSLLSATNGSWDGGAIESYAYQWLRCDTPVSDSNLQSLVCSEISGEHSSSYSVTPDDAGKAISVKVTATNSAGSTSHWSASSTLVGRTPNRVSSPAITGDPQSATALEVATGIWDSFPTISFNYQWFACASSVASSSSTLPSALGCLPITDATQSTFFPNGKQDGKYLLVKVSATNDVSDTSTDQIVYTASTAEPAATAPVSVTAPKVSFKSGTSIGENGAPKIAGEITSTQLTVNDGSWTPSVGITYSYAWYRCESSHLSSNNLDGDCVSIPGASSNEYRVQAADEQKYVLASVSATNAVGVTPVYSATTLAVSSTPVYSSGMAVSRATEYLINNSISLDRGTWSGWPELRFNYKWFACSNAVPARATLAAGCTQITGAIGETFKPTVAQKGKFVLFSVIAANDATGTANAVSQYSSTTEVAVSAAPTLKAAPLGSNGTVKYVSVGNAGNTKFTVDVSTWAVASTYTYQWYRCDQEVTSASAPQLGCELIAGANSSSYSTNSADVGKHISPYVTPGGNSSVAPIRLGSLGITMQVPLNLTAPSTVGQSFAVGQTVSANAGTWSASPEATFSYQWFTCTKAVTGATTKNAACAAIPGATGNSFVIPPAQNGKYLAIQVVATNPTNVPSGASIFSATSVKILTAPTNSAPPVAASSEVTNIGQRPIEGSTYNATPGTWVGSPAPTKTYQWYVCDSAVVANTSQTPSNCSQIPGATALTLTVTDGWHGKFISVAETASNGAGSASLFTATDKAVQNKPRFQADPLLSGIARSGETLTAIANESTAAGTPNIGYRWASCDQVQPASSKLGAGCLVIANALDDHFTPTANFEGKYLVAEVTLKNIAGSITKVTVSSQAVSGALAWASVPAPLSQNGHVRLQVPVEASSGKWTGYPIDRYSYAWFRCVGPSTAERNTLPSDCTDLSSNAKTYTPVSADSGSYLLAKVTAHQGQDQTSVYSPTSEQVYEAPTISGNPRVGSEHVLNQSVLSITSLAAPGGVPEPLSSVRWLRCNEPQIAGDAIPGSCVVIDGATARTYSFVEADVKKYIAIEVTYTNVLGSAVRYSATSSQVNSGPTNTSIKAPNSGASQVSVGLEITGTDGSWSGFPEPTYSYFWYRCDAQQTDSSPTAPSGCLSIARANSISYVPTHADAGKYLSLRVRASNSYGTKDVWSPSAGAIWEQPGFSTGPLLSATKIKGETITEGFIVSGYPEPTNSYQWFRCASPIVVVPVAVPTGCTPIVGAKSADYTLTVADVKKYVLVEHKLTSKAGKATKYSVSSQEILQIPEIANTLKLSGNTWTGALQTLSGVSVSSYPDAEVTYSWYRCDESRPGVENSIPSGCSIIVNANQQTYTLVDADKGKYVFARIRAANSAGTSYLRSSSTAYVKLTPRMQTAPYISGLDSDGEVASDRTISAERGSWNGDPGPTYAYQWYLCGTRSRALSDVIPADCALIKGQTSNQYAVKKTDALKYLAFTVKVANGTVDVIKFSGTSERVYIPPTYVSGAKPIVPPGDAAQDGSPRVGYFVEASNGTWNGKPDPTFTYQWFSCNPLPNGPGRITTENRDFLHDGCTEISDATQARYMVTQAEVDKFLGVKIRATYKTSDEVFTVTLAKPVVAPPVNVEPQIVSGYPFEHATLRTTEGEWTGNPDPTETHTWWVCEAAVSAPVTVQPAGCTALSNSGGNWKVTHEQIGKYLVSVVKSSNQAGDSRMWSSSIGPIVTGAINSDTAPPTISVSQGGEPRLEVDLVINDGTWLGDPDPMLPGNLAQFQYFWYRCETKIPAPSDSLADGCVSIETDAIKSYRPARADLGKYLLAAVRGYNSAGESVTYTASTNIVNQVPENTVEPTISGQAFVQQEISADDGVWVGAPTPTITRQWLACNTAKPAPSDVAPVDCSVIKDATANIFTPTNQQLGKFLVVRVTGTNIAGTDIAWTKSSGEVVSGPVLKNAPTFTYPTVEAVKTNPVVTKPVQTNGGEWYGLPEPDLSYQWFSCVAVVATSPNPPAPGAECVEIAGETSQSFVPTAAERGRFLVVKIHASNRWGIADQYSAATTKVLMAPVLDIVPSVQGPIFNRTNARALGDTWNAEPEVTKTYNWYLCSGEHVIAPVTLPANCSSIAGATKVEYLIPAADWGKDQYLMAKVSVRNSVGTAESYTPSSVTVKPGPVNLSEPVISGSTIYPSGSLNGSYGIWSPAAPNTPDRTVQWYRCSVVVPKASDQLDNRCALVPGATNQTYNLTSEDPGNSLLVAVTGSNSDGRSTAFSKSTALIEEVVNNVVGSEPTVTGSRKVGDDSSQETFSLTGIDGVWHGFKVPTYIKSWYLCSTAVPNPIRVSGAKPKKFCGVGPIVSGPAENTLKLTPNMVSKYPVFAVTGTNIVAGKPTTTTTFSASTAAIAKSPIQSVRPVIVNRDNTVTNAPPVIENTLEVKYSMVYKETTTTFQWFRCEAEVVRPTVAGSDNKILDLPEDSHCVAIPGETAVTHVVTFGDSGKFLVAQVIGSNAADTIHEFTKSTSAVDIVPRATILPTVTGERKIGAQLTATQGVWDDPQPAEITYQWYYCQSAIPNTVTELPAAAGCVVRNGSTQSDYVQTPSDQGKFVTVAVKARNGVSRTTYFLSTNEATAMAPESTTAPTIESLIWAVDEVFTATDGKWAAAPAPTFSYQWYKCSLVHTDSSDAVPMDCQILDGERSNTYRATQALANEAVYKYLLVAVTATNSAGSAVKTSESTSAPIDKSFVEVTSARVTANSFGVANGNDVVLHGIPGTWTYGGNPHTTLVHKWVYCTEEIKSTLSFIPDGCELMFRPFSSVTARDTQDLTLTFRQNDYAGYYIALAEYVMPNSVVAPTTVGAKVRFRLSPSTPIIKEAPSLWNDDPAFMAPSVSRDAVVGFENTLVIPGGWATSTMPSGAAKTTWRGVEVGTYAYKWFACDAAQTASDPTLSVSTIPNGCSFIGSATAASYAPTAPLVGKYLAVQVSANNSLGTFTYNTATSNAVTQEVDVVAGSTPALSTVELVGDTATLNPGTWVGAPAPAFQYLWYLCNSQPAENIQAATIPGCTAIASTGTNSTSITVPSLGASDATRYVVARVRGENSPYEDKTRSIVKWSTASSARIFESPSMKTASPIRLITNSSNIYADGNVRANVGETLKIENGNANWLATPLSGAVQYTYEWYFCTAAHPTISTSSNVPVDCSQVQGASSQTLEITRSMVKNLIMGRVITTNGKGAPGYAKTVTTPEVLEAPYNTAAPTISTKDGEAPLVGSTDSATANRGTWSQNPAPENYAYKWYRCSTAVAESATLSANCSVIAGATSVTYTPVAADRGSRLMVAETATNSINPKALSTKGTGTIYSATSNQVHQAPNFVAWAPTVSGQFHIGQTLTYSDTAPAVTAFPEATLSYGWYSCSTVISQGAASAIPAGCTQLSDPTPKNQLALTDTALAGRFVTVIVAATNSRGTSYSKSGSLKAVTRSPINLNEPTIQNPQVATAGASITVTPGAWASTPTGVLTYQWYQCSTQQSLPSDSLPAGCSAVSGATVKTLPLLRTMAGSYMLVGETSTQASNNLLPISGLAATKFSASSAVVKSAPQFNGQQTIAGDLHVGSAVSANFGAVDGFENPATSYTWYVCPAAVTASSSLVTCTTETQNADLVITDVMVNKFITYQVIASNSVNSAVSKQAPNSIKVTKTPVATTPATIAGDSEVGATKKITVTPGTWASAPAVAAADRAYSWFSCEQAVPTAASTVPSDCSLLRDANSNAITVKVLPLIPEYRGKHIVGVETVNVSPVNKAGAGTSKSISASIGPITMKPVFDANPTFTGAVHVGETLRAANLAATGYPTPEVTYNWYACGTAQAAGQTSIPAGCVLASGAVAGENYLVSDQASGKYITLVATATSTSGTSILTSAGTKDVTASLTMVASPTVSGGDSVGNAQVLSTTTGQWTSSPATTADSFQYAWFSCTAEHVTAPQAQPSDCVVIPNETAQTLVQTSTMAGKWILARVTTTVRSNKDGPSSAVSFTNTSGRIRDRPTFGAQSPTIAGSAHVGETLTATETTDFSGFDTPTSAIQWWLCPAAVSAGTTDISGTCTSVAGQTNSTILLTQSMAGKRLAVVQTIRNSIGTATKSSASTLAVSSSPVISDDPLVTGSSVFNSTTASTVSVSNGTWISTPAVPSTGYSYAWYRCGSEVSASDALSSECVVIPGATSKTYTLTSTDVAKYLMARVTVTVATNKDGAGVRYRYSGTSAQIQVAPSLVDGTVPTIKSGGIYKVGQTIQLGSRGTWNGTPAPDYSYSWYTCTTVVNAKTSVPPAATCSLIQGFDDRNLLIPSTAEGKRILLYVTASNSAGTQSATSATSSVLVAAATTVSLSSIRFW